MQCTQPQLVHSAYCGRVAELGAYLRRKRSELTPADAGLISTGIRRVPGLRREEVAWLAGVSVDYYIRLEQGRETSPSVQVLDALGAALRLDDDGRHHLFRLVGITPKPVRARVPDEVDPALVRLMASWPNNPALVYNRAYDPLATALFGTEPANLMLLVFTDPRAREFYVDWPEIAANSVAGFRLNHTAAPADPRVGAVLAQLLNESHEFRELWGSHDARGKSLATKTFHHIAVGDLTLGMQTFSVKSSPGQELVVYDAQPGSPSDDALKLLGSVAAGTARNRNG